ncbi:hypothetical protein DAPPUDRAFT_312649 [Daphnia pulex]|uniref:Uncharacterized protein n=1 Tax=Daphnia pulex TaxID=6669 RepID=E9FZT6_DAPPU|nr:hypothetical protein DAPPUDRAFT_312649 [Daphnia pulex]|eukprot:EFX87109.1 hypothetical protein DAPPUDRAFT_312649 [Daphnia pulex]
MWRDKVFLLMNQRIFAESPNFAEGNLAKSSHLMKHQEIYPTRGVVQLVAVIPLLWFFIMNISVCSLEKYARSPRTSLSPPFVHDRRGTSTNILLHPYLQDSSSFTASVLLMLLVLLHNFSCFTGELDHFSCCDKPAVTHHGIMARWLFDNYQLSEVSFSYFSNLCKHLSAAIVWNFFVKTDDNYSTNKAHLLDF